MQAGRWPWRHLGPDELPRPLPQLAKTQVFLAYKREQTSSFGAINRSNYWSHRRQVLDQNGDEFKEDKASVDNELSITELCEQSLE